MIQSSPGILAAATDAGPDGPTSARPMIGPQRSSVDARAVRERDDASISRSTMRAMRHLVNAWRDGWPEEWWLHRVSAQVSADARHRGLDAAGMVAAVAHEWPALAAVQRVPPVAAAALRHRLLAACLEAFHAADAGSVERTMTIRPEREPAGAAPGRGAGSRWSRFGRPVSTATPEEDAHA